MQKQIFHGSNSSKKRTKYLQKFALARAEFFCLFFGRIERNKRHFEINWPLVRMAGVGWPLSAENLPAVLRLKDLPFYHEFKNSIFLHLGKYLKLKGLCFHRTACRMVGWTLLSCYLHQGVGCYWHQGVDCWLLLLSRWA